MREDALYRKLLFFHYVSDATSYCFLCKLKHDHETFKVILCLVLIVLTTFIPVFLALLFVHLELLPFKFVVITSKLALFESVRLFL